jgi:hypothetical protein
MTILIESSAFRLFQATAKAAATRPPEVGRYKFNGYDNRDRRELPAQDVGEHQRRDYGGVRFDYEARRVHA